MVETPCKIGDEVWALKRFNDNRIPKKGKVSEMFFNKDMDLVIVVRNVGRGLWGEHVFATYEDCVNYLERSKVDCLHLS